MGRKKRIARKITDAKLHLAAGRLDDAEVLLLSVLMEDPGHGEALNLVLPALMARNDLGMAENIVRKFAGVCPDHHYSYYTLGTIVEERGKTDEAITHYRRAVELSPYEAVYYLYLGAACSRNGKADEALRAFLTVTELDKEMRYLYKDETAPEALRRRALLADKVLSGDFGGENGED
jgi:Flp pilus assembly protein TadD